MSEEFPSISVLIPELKSGEESAWTCLIEKFGKSLTSRTRFMLKKANLQNEYLPDDIVQETLMKAWRQHESIRGVTTNQFAMWILTILKNTMLDCCRARSSELQMATWFGFSDDAETPSAEAISIEEEANLHACLAELDPEFQQILVLRHFEGLKFSEISEQTGCSINTVAGRHRRGLVELLELMNRRSPLAAKVDSK